MLVIKAIRKYDSLEYFKAQPFSCRFAVKKYSLCVFYITILWLNRADARLIFFHKTLYN